MSNEPDTDDTFGIRGEYITLGQLLKALGEARTGGEGKLLLLGGGLRVNGEIEQRRGRKLRPGDRLLLPDGREVAMTVDDTEPDQEASAPAAPVEPPKRRFKSKIAAKRAHKADTQRRNQAADDGHQQQGQQAPNERRQVGGDGRRGLPQGFSRRGRNRPR
ncbi:MAG: RNA-binding S4 domain-containing protein [Armatimonadota bacterium]